MLEVTKLFDYYQRNARLYPALLTLLPTALVGLALSSVSEATTEIVGGIVAACGVLYLLADFARSRGKAVEKRLLLDWGGWPSTLFLRRSDRRLSESTRERYHAFLCSRLGDSAIPSPDEELRDPPAADARYATCVEWLKERTRGRDFDLLLRENAAYGFRRNLLGLKPYGVALCIVGCVAPLAWKYASVSGKVTGSSLLASSYLQPAAAAWAAFGCVLAILVWFVVVTPAWVRAAGDQYALRLLACCDALDLPDRSKADDSPSDAGERS